MVRKIGGGTLAGWLRSLDSRGRLSLHKTDGLMRLSARDSLRYILMRGLYGAFPCFCSFGTTFTGSGDSYSGTTALPSRQRLATRCKEPLASGIVITGP